MTDKQSPAASPVSLQITRRVLLQGAATVGATLMAQPRLAFAAASLSQDSSLVREALVHGFLNPPKEYRPVDNWWWEAGRLDKEKLTWQLEQLKEKGIAGSWFYVRWLYGEALSSIPTYWSEEWWELTRFALQEHRRLGLDAWASNWEANGFVIDRIRKEAEHNEAFRGRGLIAHRAESEREGPITLVIPPDDEVLDAAAYRKTGNVIDYGSRVTLARSMHGGRLSWQAPGAGWVLTAVVARPQGLDYLNPVMAQRWNEVFFGEYERRLPEFMGTVLKAFGVDEHEILNGRTLFSRELLRKVQGERGYDLSPWLIGLFYDIGPKTDQIRCDYYDAMSALLEENFSRVAMRWLEARGMQYVTASPHAEGEFLNQTRSYGDVVRYMRSYHIVGGEDPNRMPAGERNLLSAKFASSIAHLYERKRAIVMAYFLSGWGATQAENLAWTNENYAYGMNFYDRHGGFYTLMGGWYEWVPPADHFYQPHWRYWRTFADYVSRLSYILSQGKHRADVALLYPGTTICAHWVAGRQEGEGGDFWQSFEAPAIETTERIKELARALVHDGIDLDIVDDWSLQRASVKGVVLEVSGVELRAIVLPPLTTIRLGTLDKIREFYRDGGTVVSLGRLPGASAENGRDDPRVRAAIEEIFGIEPGEEAARLVSRTNSQGGKAYFVPHDVREVARVVSRSIERDVVASETGVFHTHQKVGEQDIYFLFNAQAKERDLSVRFRVDGEPERWDAFTGQIRPVYRVKREGRITEVSLTMLPHEGLVLVFSPGNARPAVLEGNISEVTSVAAGDARGEKLSLQGFDALGGKRHARILYRGREYAGEVQVPRAPAAMELQGPFDFRLEPTMDNRWGDFRYPTAPQMIGAEARRFRYLEEGDVLGTDLGWHQARFDDTDWSEVTYSYGPYWWHIGPVRRGWEPKGLLEEAKRGEIDFAAPWPQSAGELYWQPYSFSKQFGALQADTSSSLPLLTGVSDNFLSFGPSPSAAHNTHYLYTNVYSPTDADYIFYCGGQPPKKLVSGDSARSFMLPRRTQAWLNGEQIVLVTAEEGAEVRKRVRLRKGWNSVLLKVLQPDLHAFGIYAVFLEGEPPSEDPYVPRVRWFRQSQPLVYDVTPHKAKRVGWYRFQAPPGLRSMRLKVQAPEVAAWVDGRAVAVRDGVISLPTTIRSVSQVALRVVQEPGTYAGAVFEEPVTFTCESGQIGLGDWSQFGLATYSGVGVYAKEIQLNRAHLAGKVVLELGQANVAAELLVNGKPAGVRLAPPFRFDITDLVQVGANHLEIKVANTLANHMSTYPTKWVFEGQTVSGLLGPVRLRFLAPVRLTAT